mmetsp:Transcript_20501/g.38484  ORF Transcript_20501/g.38484 Transcript_20501/m.38484 type:complete len:232 (-) Transcript_20501:130-825(-)|eukprot:CAMPEP_0197440502 /NCGR_PEP_ID=MMETSP1175-20131217/6999_1 /TAXON_ID=1003142 /ORGANISM="Triceratium dubium, Strain CCMP147" /LENGTH=231 /DNA_ID=CAMNT_0042970623 /DNA_START=65 /DNA_END=760 /DNA_ORIENTATION=-
MGMVFGKIDVAEPAYDVIAQSAPASSFSWEVRRYGSRFAIEADYPEGENDDRTPFMELAGYIGVMGPAQNDGSTKIAMTAPVAIENEKQRGEKIAMTAPVAIKGDGGKERKKMQFFLPAEYDDISKIPHPTNPGVRVVEVPPEVGVVHRYNGVFNSKRSREMARELVKHLGEEGLSVEGSDGEKMMQEYQSWGYNPPFTIPYLRRNEIWVPLTEKQVKSITNLFPEAQVKN